MLFRSVHDDADDESELSDLDENVVREIQEEVEGVYGHTVARMEEDEEMGLEESELETQGAMVTGGHRLFPGLASGWERERKDESDEGEDDG